MTAGGPKCGIKVWVRNLATLLALLSVKGASKTNLEKVQTATKRCLGPYPAYGRSTKRSKAYVCLGPGGRGTIMDHLGQVMVESHN